MSEPTGIQRKWAWNYNIKDLGSWPSEEYFTEYKGRNLPVEIVLHADHVREQEELERNCQARLDEGSEALRNLNTLIAHERADHTRLERQLATAHQRINELEAREVDVVLLQQQRATTQAEVWVEAARLAREAEPALRSTHPRFADAVADAILDFADICEQQAREK